MKIFNNQFGFGDFTSLIFVGIFAVIGSLFIIRIFAASRPTITLQLIGYAHTNSQGDRDYSGIHGSVNIHDASSCVKSMGDSNWISFTTKNGDNSYDSHPLVTSGKYTYKITCKNDAGETSATQTVVVP